MSQTVKISVPVLEATPDSFKEYGNLFTDPDLEIVRLEQWPQHPKGFRSIVDGYGGGVTRGVFTCEWRADRYYASNSGVENGDYCFAQRDKDDDSELMITVTNEINYHSCGSQWFYSDAPILLLVGKISDPKRWPDGVRPSDFQVFTVPSKTGVHIDSYIWHCPPISLNNKRITVETAQARTHSKIYYDPVKEDNSILAIRPKIS